MEDNRRDDCNVRAFANYKPKPLNDAVKQFVTVFYTFRDRNDKFKIKYTGDLNKSSGRAYVYRIKNSHIHATFKTGTSPTAEISASWNKMDININNVYLLDAAGKGLCSRAIGYLIKVLLLESAKLNHFPYMGSVHVFTSNPCAAINCYAHGFMMNGFQPSSGEIQKFIEHYEKKKKEDTHVDFRFIHFISRSQMAKHQSNVKKRRIDNITTVQLKLKY